MPLKSFLIAWRRALMGLQVANRDYEIDPRLLPGPIALDPADPVEVSETEDPEEKGGKDRSDGEGDGGFVDPPTTLRL